MQPIRWFYAFSTFLVVACTHVLEGAPCPCAAGYQCCVARNACYPQGQSCPSDGAGGGDPVGNVGGGGVDASAGTAPSHAGTTMPTGSAGSPDGSAGFVDAGAGGSSPLDGAAGASGTMNDSGFELVATQHNDNARTGANLHEAALNVASVQATFGQLSRRPLRGALFAQPLVAPAVKLPSGETRDLVYVATMANAVYALDARNPEHPPIWTRILGSSIVLPDPLLENGAGQIWHEVGILGTPVLSVEYDALYLVAATKEGDSYGHRLYKLKLSTGEELASEAIRDFDFVNAKHAQWGALTLAAGVLYVPFGGYDPGSDESGWIFSFDANLASLGRVRLGDPSGAGVTMSGQGAAADDQGSIFFATEPGLLAAGQASNAPGSHVLALQGFAGSARVSALLSCTATGNCPSSEFGSSGALLIPNSNQLVVAGQRQLYLLNQSAVGGSGPALVQTFRASDSIVCDSSEASCAATPSSPVFWPGSGQKPAPRLFAWTSKDRLRSFRFDPEAQRFACGGNDSSCPTFASGGSANSGDVDGQALASAAHLSVSSLGSKSKSGIVWAAHPYTRDSLRNADGILRAFDAEDLALTWSTAAAGTPLGPLAPGATPTVSGGRVFMGTADGISSKITFTEEHIAGPPAITNFADQFLVLAWSPDLPEKSRLKLTWSTDGIQFGNSRLISDNLFSSDPALAADDHQIYLAWTAVDTKSGTFPVKVAVSADPSFAHPVYMTSRLAGAAPGPLAYTAIGGPALAYGNHRLFLAFQDNRRIVVLSSQDGSAFDTETILANVGYASYETPALAYLGGKLYLMSIDPYGRLNVFVSTDDGAHFAAPTTLPVTSVGHPTLITVDTQVTNQPDLYVLWSDTTNLKDQDRIKLASIVDGDFSRLLRSHEFEADTAKYAVSAARFRDAWYVTWMGTGESSFANVARYSPGELVTYGLKPRP